MQSSGPGRVVLFLQGPASIFWSELAEAFEAAGARVLRIRLSAADHLFWRRPGAVSYRGSLADWPRYLEAFLKREGVTDIVCYADRPPYHAAASKVAARLAVPCHIVENGYLRPDWITLERGGMGVFSHFPNDPETIRAIAPGLPEPDLQVRYRHGFAELALHEVAYDLLNVFGRPFYLRWNADKYYHPFVDYLSWVPRFFHIDKLRRAAAEVEAWRDVPFHLLAMQLQPDYQIRSNSHYGHLSEMFDEVVTSFAAHAAPDARLVIKLHPNDNGLERWDRVAEELAVRRGAAGRVHVIIGGDLGRMLAATRGVILVNSTVGIHALRALKPLKVLGGAVYDVPGMTHQGSLDAFWNTPESPDPDLVESFIRVLAAAIQVKGDFYDPEGRRVAIATIVERILEKSVNEPGAYVDPPPRLARFEAAGAARKKS